MDFQKWIHLALLGAAAVVFLFAKKVLETIWYFVRVPSFLEEWPVAPVDILAFGIAIAGLVFVKKNGRAMGFLGEVAQELSKVVWPNRKETVLSTGVVLVMVSACTLVLFLIDIMWGTITRGIMTG